MFFDISHKTETSQKHNFSGINPVRLKSNAVKNVIVSLFCTDLTFPMRLATCRIPCIKLCKLLAPHLRKSNHFPDNSKEVRDAFLAVRDSSGLCDDTPASRENCRPFSCPRLVASVFLVFVPFEDSPSVHEASAVDQEAAPDYNRCV